jgi:hypothetical protein
MPIEKVLWLFLLVSMIAVTEARGQMSTVGLKGGLNWTNIGGPDAGDFQSRTSVSLGGFAVLRLGDVVAIQPEVLYTPKGGRAEALEGTGGVRLQYVDMPLLFNFTHPALGTPSLRPHLLVGPVVSLRLGCEVDVDLADTRTMRCDDPLLGGELATRSTDWGVLFGGGVEFGMGALALVLDARYNLGLVSFGNSPSDQDVRNRALSVLLGLGYRPGR